MATSSFITSPYERIKDISTRRKIDIKNRTYFLVDITNALIDFLKKTNYLDNEFSYIKLTPNTNLSEIENIFKEVSNYFYLVYQKLSSKEEINIDESKIIKIRKLIKENRNNS